MLFFPYRNKSSIARKLHFHQEFPVSDNQIYTSHTVCNNRQNLLQFPLFEEILQSIPLQFPPAVPHSFSGFRKDPPNLWQSQKTCHLLYFPPYKNSLF